MNEMNAILWLIIEERDASINYLLHEQSHILQEMNEKQVELTCLYGITEKLKTQLDEKEGARQSSETAHQQVQVQLQDKEAELKGLYVSVEQMKAQLDEKEGARQSSETAHQQVQVQLQDKEAELKGLYVSVEQMKAQLDEKEGARQSSETAHQQVQVQLQDKEAELKGLYVSVEQMKAQLDEKEGARQSSETAHQQVQVQLQDKEAELKGLYVSVEQMKSQLDEKEGARQSSETAHQQVQVQLQDKEAELKGLYVSVEQMKAQLDEKEGARQSSETAHQQVQVQLQDKEAELKGLYVSVEQMKVQLQDKESELNALYLKVNHIKLQIDQKESIIGELSGESNNIRAQLTTKQVELEKSYANAADLLKQCQEKEDVIQGLITTYKVLRILKEVRPRLKKYTQKFRDIFKIRLGQLYQHPPIPLILPKGYQNPGTTKLPPIRISLVTPSYKQANFIERTLKSVLDQQYQNLEYFVQDGASEDGTAELLVKYNDQLTGWESTSDKGQSHAINLGMQRTTGEIMAWLNSDDILLPGSLAYISDFFNRHPEIDVVYGHRMLIDENDNKIGRWMVPAHDNNILSWADFVPQETLFWRRRIWEKIGGRIDESFRFAMDWDLIVRFRDAGARFVRLPRFIGGFRIHPQQKTSANIADIGIQEMGRIRTNHLGKLPSDAEIQIAIWPYLRRHIMTDLAWRIHKRLISNR